MANTKNEFWDYFSSLVRSFRFTKKSLNEFLAEYIDIIQFQIKLNEILEDCGINIQTRPVDQNNTCPLEIAYKKICGACDINIRTKDTPATAVDFFPIIYSTYKILVSMFEDINYRLKIIEKKPRLMNIKIIEKLAKKLQEKNRKKTIQILRSHLSDIVESDRNKMIRNRQKQRSI